MIQILLKWLAAFFICLILQTTLVPVIGFWGTQPDLIVLVLCLFSLKFGIIPGVFIGFFVGLGLDIYAPSLLGQHALAMTVCGFCAGIFNEKMVRTDPLLKMAIILACFIMHDMLFVGVELIKNDKRLFLMVPQIFSRTLPRGLYTVVIAFGYYFWNTNIKPNLSR